MNDETIDPLKVRLNELPSKAARVTICLAVTNGMINLASNHRLEKFGLSLAKFNLLAMLQRQPQRMLPQAEIKDRLFVTKQNVAALVDRLVNEGLVERVEDTEDRRSNFIRLTAQGEELQEKAYPEGAAMVEEMLTGMDTEDYENLERLLLKMRRSLSVYLEQNRCQMSSD